MSIADLAIMAAVILAFGVIGLAKGVGWAEYDNARPRAEGFYQSGWLARAHGAHQNGLEALPFFIAAVLLAEFRSAPQGLVDGLAAAFIASRLAYIAAYLGDRASLRSIVWLAGFGLNIALFLTPLARR